ncbi:MAG: tRNA uridine-5-carboxymethylaminomethyl(34) synthesis GTPase MnmE [Ignavibacteriae bacterium HGW-Ignavibacteriae-4]|jgi:tRNA modification GTPase|nr:MAG: tRNA uridine-5-carboxymethylaminomethyl(34) synthesis GTPase MnmE [Ignavibacteriae bacterium HGW-Ignavibacteriae-4]
MSRTIAALATAPGIAGLNVVRISGEKAISIADKCFVGKKTLADAASHTIQYGNFVSDDTLIDTVTASIFKAPNSYTGEDTIEFGCHGGNIVAGQIVDALLAAGAVMPEPGEFTRTAFLNGKLDLTQVEAVADIIHSTSVAGALTSARQLIGEFTQRLKDLRHGLIRTAGLLELELDFSEEDIELIDNSEVRARLVESQIYCNDLADKFRASEVLRSGFIVAVAGFPNSGKSTLFNKILQKNRAIVSEIEGTTRDYIEEDILLGDIKVRLIDTAGLRETEDIIEIAGIKFVESVLEQSNLVLVLNDASKGFKQSDELFSSLKEKYPNSEFLLVQNKSDLVESKTEGVFVSAKTGDGIDKVTDKIKSASKGSIDRLNDVLINKRHADLLRRTTSEIQRGIDAIDANMQNEIIAIDIRNATNTLGEITGDRWNEEVLAEIFSGFCIGK